MQRWILLAATALTLSACQTIPVSGASAPSGGPSIPSGALALGDWRDANAASVAQAFEREIDHRYRVGLALSAVNADLRGSAFTCAANREAAGRGDPPDQICRHTVSAENCTHTWQVHLYDEAGNAALARTRALYDRRCGGDGLLGGPG
jgi:hypothetical protein